MRTIFVNSNILDILNESIIKEELPDFILSDVENGKTSFGNNPAFPNGTFLSDLYSARLSTVSSKLKSLKSIDNVKSTDTNNALGEIIEKCKDEERPYREKLESLCAKIVIELFTIPEDSIGLDLNLVDDVNLNGEIVQFDTVDSNLESPQDIDFSDLKSEVSKRQIISALNMGYGMLISNRLKSYISEIYEINPKLVDLYHEFILLSEYSLFTNSHEKMTEKNNLQIGTTELDLCQVDEVPIIKSCGVIFPVLLCETVRGFMELFSSHGLPNEKKKASEVLKRTDYLLSEPWYMRTGLSLWEIIEGQIDDFDERLLPYLYRRICTLGVNDFIMFMQHVLSKTKKGKHMLSILVDRAKSDYDDCGQDKMDNPDVDGSIITDNYIREEEL